MQMITLVATAKITNNITFHTFIEKGYILQPRLNKIFLSNWLQLTTIPINSYHCFLFAQGEHGIHISTNHNKMEFIGVFVLNHLVLYKCPKYMSLLDQLYDSIVCHSADYEVPKSDKKIKLWVNFNCVKSHQYWQAQSKPQLKPSWGWA